jgi:glycosyltransferase involved in cell wall biosynthesis
MSESLNKILLILTAEYRSSLVEVVFMSRSKKNSPGVMEAEARKTPLVSVVVPTFNSSATLAKCLQSVKNQCYERIEMIVVDRYSEDETVRIAKHYGATVLLTGPERSSQKNYGARHSSGEFVYFVDSDFVLEEDTVSRCVDGCKDFDAVATINYSVGHSLWGKSIELKERFLAHDPTIETVKFVRRTAFLQIGGFDQSLIVGEDLDLYRRLQESGFKIRRIRAIEWHAGEPETLKDIAKRSFYYGKVVKAYLKKRKGYAVRQLSPVKPSLILTLIETGSPFLPTLLIVDITRWMSSSLGLLCSNRG